MISRNSIIINRQIPFVLRAMYRQNTPILRNNLVTILPPNPNQASYVFDSFKAEYGVALMGAYMFAIMGIMSWIYYQDIAYHIEQNIRYRQSIETLTEKNTCYLTKIGYLEDRINRLEHILLENKPER